MFEEPTARGNQGLTATVRRARGSFTAGEIAVLAEVTRHLLGALDVDAVVHRGLSACVPRIARWAQLLVPGRYGYCCTTAGPRGDRISTLEVPHPAVGGSLSGHARVLATGLAEVVALDPVAPWIAGEQTRRSLHALGAAELLVLPLVARGVPFGTLTLADLDADLAGDDQAFVGELAGRMAVAIDGARIHAEQTRLADAFAARQGASWPAETAGLVLAPRLRRGTRPSEDGGDFLDVVGVPGDWVLVLGDVVPCRVPAPLLSMQARDFLRGASRFERRPAELLRALNAELAERTRPGDDVRLLSALCVRARRASADALIVSVSSAGHPRPLVIRRGGRVEEVAVQGLLCGASTSTTYAETQLVLDRDDLLLLVSDGVPDAKGYPGRFGVDRLARLAGTYRESAPAALAEAVDLAVAEFTATRPGAPVDDFAVVVLGLES
ncbi:hypothetical protein GCM10020369_12030 [Cryptosporangium minutisporangium]|uniref:PPM-type phosphatase domain-containing protein n=2 Tax=Cryptosporangium minutisporangium TaxID=113569 RepID=A0ABP6SSP6_9ACTN